MQSATLNASEVLDATKAVLERHPELRVGIVYGSAASGHLGPESDVDVAVLGEKELTLDERLTLADEIEQATHRHADVVDLYSANGTILAEILGTGQRVLVRSTGAVADLIRRMVYNQADEMPAYRRILDARRRRFTGAE